MKNYYPYRLGIDLGTNSLGFALVELKNGEPFQLIHMGVRIFSDGREAQTKTSLAVARREARGTRRRRDRLVRRQQQLMELLIAKGLMPIDRNDRKKLESIDPYELRMKALDTKLSPYEIGRALFHINQRRGFQSNRKQALNDKDTGSINKAKRKLEESLQKYRTIGEFLYHNSVKRVRPSIQGNKNVYDFYPQRDMLKEESETIMQNQAKHHPNILKMDVIEELKDVIFHQRNLRPVQTGRCSLMPDERRAYAALPSSQRFRVLKEVNNLKILDKLWRRNSNDLTDEQKKIATLELYKSKKISFETLRKKLEFDSSTVFNLESEHRDSLEGATTSIALSQKKCFGDIWQTLNLDKQDEIVAMLFDDNISDDELSDWLKSNFANLSDAQIKCIIATHLEDGTLRYSTEAIKYLLPHLESGKNEHDAREECKKAGLFPNSREYTGEIINVTKQNKFPYYGTLLETHVAFGTGKPDDCEEKRYGKIPNPTVHIALNQIRRLVNDLIPEFGTPDEIAIELSRDLKLNEKDKKRLNEEIKKNTKANNKYNEDIISFDLQPSDEYRLRLKLHKQQAGLCLYSGNAIELKDALGDATEIDHILPFSRTLDDTIANKALVLTKFNRIKENKSPYEAFSNSLEINYEELQARVSSLPASKKWRFQQDAMQSFEEEKRSGDKGWLARQLNDTSYMARVARDYLRYITGKVDTYPGGMTAKLRTAWGFNSLINPGNNDEKNRDDHRHHAIDALVIACCDRSKLNAISKASGKGEKLEESWVKNLVNNVPPYSNFNRNALEDRVKKIVISHKPDHGSFGNGGTSGRLHEDTFYGLVKQNKGEALLTVTQPLPSLIKKDKNKLNFSATFENLCSIRDEYIRNKIIENLGTCFRAEVCDIKKISDELLEMSSHYYNWLLGEELKSKETLKKQYKNRLNEITNMLEIEKFEKNLSNFSVQGKNGSNRNFSVRAVRILEKKSQKSMRVINDKNGKPYRYVATGGNHHIDIFCPIKDVNLSDGREYKANKWYAETISTFDANQKGFEPEWKIGRPSIKRIIKQGKQIIEEYEWKGFATAKLIMRLHINDMVAYEKNGKTEIRRVKKIKGTEDKIYLVSHLVANESGDKLSWGASANQLQIKNARKITVTPSGKVYDAGKSPAPKQRKKIDVAA